MSRICLPLILIATLAVSVIASTSPSSADEPDERRVEMGNVDWKQDFESARQIASQTSKPMFVLFQEIPGCQTCQTFGQRPLSHPLMVEAIEELFVPVLVFNNRKGKDAILLERFSEPSWNNPVVRYLDPAGKDLIERKANSIDQRDHGNRDRQDDPADDDQQENLTSQRASRL